MRHDRVMTEEEYDDLLKEIVANELAMHYAAVAGVADDELDELLDES
jgi:hypothetical protein